MTDQELIQLLQEKPASEFTSAEIEAIRARWTQSPELRQALVEHLQLESQLMGALAPVQMDVDAILQRAAQQRRLRRFAVPRWSWLLGLCLLVAMGMGLFVLSNRPRPNEKIAEHEQPTEQGPAKAPADVEPANPAIEPSSDANVADASPATVTPPTEVTPDSPAPPVEPIKPVKPVENEIAANEPWSVSLARETVPWPANSPKLTDDYKVAGHDELPDAEAKRWLASVEGQPYVWSTDPMGNPARRIARFNGLAKLRAPWPEDAVLRVTPFDVTDLTIYFWHGPTGVALRFHTRRDPHMWSAFEVSRENSSPKPSRWGLLTTDNGAYIRSVPGTLDFRVQGNDLVLARGGLVLMSVPFSGRPLEVFVEGQFRLRGLSMFRSAPFVTRPETSHPVVVSGPAAALPWCISAEYPANLVTHDDGAVSLTVDSRDRLGSVSLPFGWLRAMQESPRATGLFEVIVKVESADPGTGIFLGDRNGRPLQQLGFFRDAGTQQITFGPLRPGEQRVESNYNPNDYAPPYLAKSGWLKMTAGLGTLHIQVSGDGKHWGHIVENPARDLPGAVGSMGLFGLQGPNARTIKIQQVQVRELTGITNLADDRLRSLVKPFQQDQLRDPNIWRHHVLDTQPAQTETRAWLTANAVTALSQGPSRELGWSLIRQLVTVGLKSNATFDEKRELLDDASALCDLFDDGWARQFAGWYEELGWQMAQTGHPIPLAKLRPAWLWSPLWTNSRLHYVPERLASYEILRAVYDRDWPTTWLLARSTPFWNLLPSPDHRLAERGEDLDRHARWAKALVGEFSPQLEDGTAGIMPGGLRHPLLPALNKEAYNVRAELQSALSGRSYEDACRIVMSIAAHDGPGLLPDVEDRELFVSTPTAIASARKAHPGFAEVMTEKFEAQGLIRVRSAINRGDVAGLQAVTLQFMGTDAARDAHTWLGDRALSMGQFDVAEQHFRDALVDAGPRKKELLEPRLTLAQALGGELSPAMLDSHTLALPAGPVELNGMSISPSELTGVIKDLAGRAAATDLLPAPLATPSMPLAQSAYKLEPRGQFDGQPGNNPGRWEFRFGDTFGRQLAVAVDDQRFYVSNRFQVNAYSVANGQQLWAQGLGSEQGEAYGLPFTPMRPLVIRDRIFVRRLTKAGAELACLSATDGQVVWHQRPSQSVLTDPVVWNGRLFALLLTKIEEDLLQVEAAWFNSSTGLVTSTRPLFRLRDSNDRQFSAQLTIADRVAVCTVSGTTASFDCQGEMHWLRRHLLMQRPVDELSEDARYAAPIVQADRVIVSMPGVREISCLDLETGRTLWQHTATGLRGIAGATDNVVIADTVRGLVALDQKKGQLTWSDSSDSRLEGFVTDGTQLIVSRRATIQHNRSKPLLMWLDSQTGQELGQTLLQTGEREEVQIGPLFMAGGKWWSFLGQTWKEPKRELVELMPVSGPVPAPFQSRLGAWKPDLSDGQLGETQFVVPGWFPVANYRDRITLQTNDVRGESLLLLSKVDAQHQIEFTSAMKSHPQRKQSLKLRVGNQSGQQWNLAVRLGVQQIFNQTIEDAGSQNGWRDISIELPSVEHDVSLRVVQSAINNAAADALLKRAEVIVE